ncbi:MAG: mannosyl-3-phosphoglycerate synthase [Thermoprotei archaeon]|nr:MAG: mannosyl-3-phosphoglycerate synthase [Thermoprotei archaeon]
MFMKLELPRYTERFGSVKIHDIQRVLLLDSSEDSPPHSASVCSIPRSRIEEIERRMAIVIPVKNEKLKVLEGVISAIPSECLIIIVSNSRRNKVDRFRMEYEMVEQYVYYTKRAVWMIHQKDAGVGSAVRKIGYEDLLDEKGLVHDGKAEGMILGMLLAKASGKDYVGFIDADNYIPGAVHEYVKIYSAAFCLAQSPYVMVRISWAYKPKILEGSLYFSKWGRVSKITNKYLNKLITSFTGFETEVVKTGNSGEHAMTMKLAELLDYSSRFAIETGEIINILEQFGGVLDPKFYEPMEKGVEIFQIETRNPHFHEEKGDEHIREMLFDSLLTIVSSPLCPDSLRSEIFEKYPDMAKSRSSASRRVIRSFINVDVKSFLDSLISSNSIIMLGRST